MNTKLDRPNSDGSPAMSLIHTVRGIEVQIAAERSKRCPNFYYLEDRKTLLESLKQTLAHENPQNKSRTADSVEGGFF